MFKRITRLISALLAVCLLCPALLCCAGQNDSIGTPLGSPTAAADTPGKALDGFTPIPVIESDFFYFYNNCDFDRLPMNIADYTVPDSLELITDSAAVKRAKLDRLFSFSGSSLGMNTDSTGESMPFMGFSFAPDGKTIYITNNFTSSVDVRDLRGEKKASFEYKGHEEGFDILVCSDRYLVLGNSGSSLCVFTYGLNGELLSRQILSTGKKPTESARFYTMGTSRVMIMREDGLFSSPLEEQVGQVATVETRIFEYDPKTYSFHSFSSWAQAETGEMWVSAWLNDDSMRWNIDLSAYGRLSAIPLSYDPYGNIYLLCTRTDTADADIPVIVKANAFGNPVWMFDCKELFSDQNVLGLTNNEDFCFYLDYGVQGEVHAVFITREGMTVYSIY